MDKEWDTFADKEKQNKEDCENSRIDKFKEWIQKDWLAINTKKIDSKKTKIDKYRADLTKCKDDDCKAQVQSKLDYYTNLMGSLTKMKEFFLLQLGKNQKKTFEVSPTLLEYEKDLSYYKSNKAKNELLVFDNQIRMDY